MKPPVALSREIIESAQTRTTYDITPYVGMVQFGWDNDGAEFELDEGERPRVIRTRLQRAAKTMNLGKRLRFLAVMNPDGSPNNEIIRFTFKEPRVPRVPRVTNTGNAARNSRREPVAVS